MTQVEFERALARTLKSIFDDANFALSRLRKLDPGLDLREALTQIVKSGEDLNELERESELLESAIEGLCVVCAKIETLKIFADSMVEGCE